jgi:hypothetical protein
MTTERWNEINDIAHDYGIEDFGNPKEPLCAVRFLTMYYDEIMNGGFYQYFLNSRGYDFHDHHLLTDALETAGMGEFAGITNQAILLAEECESDDEETAGRAGVQIENLSFDFDDMAFIEKLYAFADKII